MKHLRKILSVTLVLSLFLSLYGYTPAAAADNEDDYRYYNQLNETESLFYDAICGITPDMLDNSGSATVKLAKQLKYRVKSDSELDAVIESVGNAFNTAIGFMDLDNNTDLFWLDNAINMSGSYRQSALSGDEIVLDISVTVSAKNIYRNKEAACLSRLVSAVEAIEISGASRYEKVKSIHDTLCSTIKYAYTESAFDVYGALVEKKAVCEGYARAFKLLCDRENIPCVLIGGKGMTPGRVGESHMWNYVLMDDGKWYAVDVTWDDDNSGILYDFFLAGGETISREKQSVLGLTFGETHIPVTHPAESENARDVAYPVLSETAYEHSGQNHSKESSDLVLADCPDVPDINVVLSGLNIEIDYNNKYISTSSAMKNLNSLIQNYDELNISAVNKSGKVLSADDFAGTGTVISIYGIDNSRLADYTLVVLGDTNGDGKISALDARDALRASAKIISLDDSAFLAADIKKEGRINASAARLILRVSAGLDSF